MRASDICADTTLTEQEKWKKIYGTDFVGNLPQNKKSDHVGYRWKPCPYSTSSTELQTRHMLNLASTDPLPTKVDHIQDGKEYFMDKDYRGVWGFECTFSGCPHLLDTGKNYFYR